VLGDAEPKQLSFDEVASMNAGHRWPMLGTYLWASNSRTRSHRAEKLFGYKPGAPTLWEALEADLLVCIEK